MHNANSHKKLLIKKTPKSEQPKKRRQNVGHNGSLKKKNSLSFYYLENCFRRTRHAGHCRDKLIRDVLLWTPTHGRAKAGRPAQTYIQQLCEDTGCCPEDLPRAMNDR